MLQTSLSICLITRNEGKNLFRCLSSINSVAAEIIVVDTGSSDDTIAIAQKFSQHVYSYKWTNDFSSARNFCLEKANEEWILFLDGDEELAGGSMDILQERIQVKDVEAYFVNVKSDSDINQELRIIPDMQLRLFRNNQQYRYKGIVNEQIIDSILEYNPSAKIEDISNLSLIHHGYTDEEHENRLKRKIELIKLAWGQEDNQRAMHFYLGREYYRHQNFKQALEHFSMDDDENDTQSFYIPELICFNSICLYLLDRTPEAIEFIDKALEERTDINDLYYLQGYFCTAQGDYIKAYETFNKFLQAEPQPSSYAGAYQYKNKIYFYLGSLAEYFMDKDEALYYYLESIRLNPYELDSLRRMVAILNPQLNPDYTIQALNKVFDLSDAALQLDLAVIFYDEGAYRLALNCIKMLENSGFLTEKAILLKGLCLLYNRQYIEAEAQLELISQPDLYITARQHLLLYYWLIKNDQKAAQCLQEITSAGADTEMITVLNMLFSRYPHKGNLIGNSKLYALAKGIMGLLVQYGLSSKTAEAFQKLEPVLGKRPSPLLAELFYKWGEYEAALNEFGSLLEIDNMNAWALYYLGKIHWHQGNLNETGKYLCRAVDSGLNTPKARLELARLRQEQVIAELSEYFFLCPADRSRKNIISELENHLIEI